MRKFFDMKKIIGKFLKIEKDITSEKGPFKLFGLFLRKYSFYEWDLVVSAPWLPTNEIASNKYITNHLRTNLEKKEMRDLARVALVPADDPLLPEAMESFRDYGIHRDGYIEMKNEELFGQEIRRAYVLSYGN